MKKNTIKYVTEKELKRMNSDLIDVSGGIKGEISLSLGYVTESIKHIQNQNLENISSYLLTRIARGHPFKDGNKRTAYFGAKYFLMKNGADFDGSSYQEASKEVEDIAKKSNLNSAYGYAKKVCKKGIIKNQVVISDYDTFFRVIIKSIGVAKILSEM